MKTILLIVLFLFSAGLFAQPDWAVKTYTNSTTAYGIVTLNGSPATAGDRVGAFVGTECRANEEVILPGDGKAYVSLQIQGEVVETVSFKVWDASDAKELNVAFIVLSSPGNTIGSPPTNYLPIDATFGDHVAPTVTALGPVPANNTLNTFNVVLTFSEKVTGVEAALAGSTGKGGVASTTDGIVYTVTFIGADYASLRLILDKSKVADVSANANILVAGLDLAYTVGDHVVPTAAVVPSANSNAVNNFNIVITFSEVVNVPAGAISVTGGTAAIANIGNVYTVSISASDLAVVTLNLSSAITDKSLNANHLVASAYNYTVGDNTAPLAVTMTPNKITIEDNHPVFVIEFNENVFAGSGNLHVYKENVQGALVVVLITSSMVSGTVVTIPYSSKTNGTLDKNSSYYVFVDAGAVKDAGDNAFAGIKDKTVWTFTTGNKFATSVNEIQTSEFHVYPNPFNNFLQIENCEKLKEVVISNLFGQSILEVQNPGHQIRTEHLVSGLYIVTCFTKNGIAHIEKIVKMQK